MTLKSLQAAAAAATTAEPRSPGLFTGSKPGNNGHRFSPEDTEEGDEGEEAEEEEMHRLIVTLHGAFVSRFDC